MLLICILLAVIEMVTPSASSLLLSKGKPFLRHVKLEEIEQVECNVTVADYCPERSYCQVEVGECMQGINPIGFCVEMTPRCTREYRHVCGCDGNTYSNACMAGAKGVNIEYDGECTE